MDPGVSHPPSKGFPSIVRDFLLRGVRMACCPPAPKTLRGLQQHLLGAGAAELGPLLRGGINNMPRPEEHGSRTRDGELEHRSALRQGVVVEKRPDLPIWRKAALDCSTVGSEPV